MAVFKCVFKINMGPQGWEEIYYFAGSNQLEPLFAGLSALQNARVRLLSRSAAVVGIRYEQIDLPSPPDPLVRPVQRPSDYFRPLTVQRAGTRSLLTDPWTALLINLYTLDGAYRRSLTLRGCATNDVRYDPRTPKVPPTLDTTFSTNMDTFLTVLRQRNQNAAAGSGPWCILGRDKSEAVRQTMPIESVGTAGTTDPRFTIEVQPGTPYDVGDTVHVHNVNDCSAKGINGDSVVMAVETDSVTFNTILTLSRRQCCVGTIDYDGKATVYKVFKTLAVPIGIANIGRVVKRDTGRPFGGTPGRRRRTCCR